MSRFLLALAVALVLATPAVAESPAMQLEYLDLLPLGEFERQDFRAAHIDLARRLEANGRKIRDGQKKLGGIDRKNEAERKKVQAGLLEVQKATLADLAELRELLRPHGMTDSLLVTMGSAPKGESRALRYAHHLVFLVDGLQPDQRAIFERVVPEVNGAYLAAQALRDRTKLSLEQAALEPRQKNAILYGFRRQTRVLETRFWQLVDYVLEDDQKAELWELLPSSIRRHASPQDHVYALPNLRPSQGARVKALVTEVEAESAPDDALVRRLRKTVRDKKLSPEERKAQAIVMREAQGRMGKLRRFAHDTAIEILDDDQIHLLKAIPPRVSANDRRQDGKRVLKGMAYSPAQEEALKTIRLEGKQAAKAYRTRMSEVRKEAGDVGPDSPQMMEMQMMMMSARGEALTTQRHLLGRVFREVLTPDQISGWVMGLYGDRR